MRSMSRDLVGKYLFLKPLITLSSCALFLSAEDIISYNLDLYSETESCMSSRKGGIIAVVNSISGVVLRNLYFVTTSTNRKFLSIDFETVITYFSTYLWLSACFAVNRFAGSSINRDLIRWLPSSGESINNSSNFGLELWFTVPLDVWFKRTDPNPFPTAFRSFSVGSGSADTMHSTFTQIENGIRLCRTS